MSARHRFLAAGIAALALVLAGAMTAQATPGKSTRCSNCHGGPTLTVNATATTVGPTSTTYSVNASGADSLAVFNGTTKVGSSVSGSSATFTLPAGATYTIFAVKGPSESSGLGSRTVTPVAPPADTAPPVTRSNALDTYVGGAVIDLTADDGAGGSGVRTTYWALDGGTQNVGTRVAVDTAGVHTLEYWSVDVAGNVETPRGSATFTIVAPPVDALPTTLSLSTSAAVVPFAGTATLRGTLLSGAALAGKTVVLERSSDSVSWSSAGAVAVTDALGGFVLTARPTAKTYYRVVFAGDEAYAASVSGPVAVTPRASVSTPVAPSSSYAGRVFRPYGYLKPRHTAGTYPVRLQFYRLEGGRYVLRKTVSARAYDYSSYTKYVGSVALPYRGTWRIRAYHPADSKHAAAYSTYRTMTVR